MTRETVWLDGQPIELRPDMLLQTGGEGAVYAWGAVALKRYHDHDPQQQARLQAWRRVDRSRLPQQLYLPSKLMLDANGAVCGFSMPRLPDQAISIKKLASPKFCLQQQIKLTTVLDLLAQVADSLSVLHAQGIVVGDLNDRNLHVELKPTPKLHWLDCDSFQLPGHPCPVADPHYLDPQLYHVTQFDSASWFTPSSDWYAFHVLFVRLLLLVHPYGGVHPQHKSIQARAMAQLPVWDSTVTMPTSARPFNLMSPMLQRQLRTVFEQTARQPLPSSIIRAYARTLVTCRQCGQEQPAGTPSCHYCAHTTLPKTRQSQPQRLLWHGEATLMHVAVEAHSGRCRCITQTALDAERVQYKLIELGVSGPVGQQVLFEGAPGYHFAISGELIAAAPPHAPTQFVVLQRAPTGVNVVGQSTTVQQQHGPLLCAYQGGFLRLAGGYLQHACLTRHGLLDATVAPLPAKQSTLESGGCGQMVAGSYNVMRDVKALWLAGGALHEFALPQPAGAGQITAVRPWIGRQRIAFHVTTRKRGMTQQWIHAFQAPGAPWFSQLLPDGVQQGMPWRDCVVALDGDRLLLLQPAGVKHVALGHTVSSDDQLYPHPRGLLLAGNHTLYLLREDS